MSLKKSILNNWQTDVANNAHRIPELGLQYPGWTIKYSDSYGVAIPYSGSEAINEYFSNAQIKSDTLVERDGTEHSAIILVADFSVAQEPFLTLCEGLLSPGENGRNRSLISQSPVAWWQDWKDLIGNRTIDEKVYDTLGELCVFKYYISIGEEANWDGPNSSTYDIEFENGFVEVKSTTSRSKREVTISNQFQLDPPGKKLDLVLCQFEHSVQNGISIDQIVQDLINMGISHDYLNSRLVKKGLEEGMSARKRTFILHDMLRYNITEEFPRITPASFIGGVLPLGITKITYTVSLDGLEAESLIQGDNHEIQNN